MEGVIMSEVITKIEKVSIPQGEYEAVCLSYNTYNFRGQKKVCLIWEVDIEGCSVLLEQHFNVSHSYFKDTTKYYTSYTIVNQKRPERREFKRMSPKMFVGAHCLVTVVNAKPKFKSGKLKPDSMSYSLIDEIIDYIGRCDNAA